MSKSYLETKNGYSKDVLLEGLLGGTSLRESEKLVPKLNLNLAVNDRILQAIENLCTTRDLDIKEVWKRILLIIHSPQYGHTLRKVGKAEQGTSICMIGISPIALEKLENQANNLNILVTDLIYASILRLEELLHVGDNYEYTSIKWSETALVEIQSNLEKIESHYANNFHGIFGDVSALVETAIGNIDEALYKVNTYLSAHALPSTKRSKQLYNAKEACAYIGISRSTLSRSMSSGKLQFEKLDGHIRFKVEWLDNFMENSRIN